MSGSLPQKNSSNWTSGLPANSEAKLFMFLKHDVVLERGKGEVVPKFPSTITQSVVAPNSEFIYFLGVGGKRAHITLYYAHYATLLFSTVLFLLYTLPSRNLYPNVKI